MRITTSIFVALFLAVGCFGQNTPNRQAGVYIAAAYNYDLDSSFYGGFGPYTFPDTACKNAVSLGSRAFNPFNVNASVLVTDSTPANTETVAFISQNLNAGLCILSLAVTKPHVSYHLSSGTYGLQEAINDAMQNGGGNIVVDSKWRGTTAMITSAVGSALVSITDNRTGSGLYTWNGTSYVLVGVGGSQATINGITGFLQTQSTGDKLMFCAFPGAFDPNGIWCWFGNHIAAANLAAFNYDVVVDANNPTVSSQDFKIQMGGALQVQNQADGSSYMECTPRIANKPCSIFHNLWVGAINGYGPFAPGYSDTLLLLGTHSPTSGGTACRAGEVTWDASNLYICTVGGLAGAATWQQLGFGGTLPTGVAKGSKLKSNGINQIPAYQTEPLIDARDKGIDCTGSADMSATLTALTDNISGGAAAMNGNGLAFPPGCVVKLGSNPGWLIRNLSGFKIMGWSGAGANGTPGENIPVFKYTGAAGGTIISMDHDDGFDVERIGLDGNRLASIGISVDETTCAGCATANDGIFRRLYVSDSNIGGPARTDWAGIYLSPTSLNDVGDMRIVDSSFFCHATSTGSAEIVLGPTFNVKNITIRHNNLGGGCAYGIWKKGGNFTVQENEFSNNQVASIRIDNGTDVDRIENNNEECDPQFLQSGSSYTVPLVMIANHFSPNICRNGSVYHIDVGNSNYVTFKGNAFDIDANLSLVVGSSVVGGAGPHWDATGNSWPNTTWVPSWIAPTTGNVAHSAFALNPERLAAYMSNMSFNLLETTTVNDASASPAFTMQARTGDRSLIETYGIQAVPNIGGGGGTNSTLGITANGGYATNWLAVPLQLSGLNFSQAVAPNAPSLSTGGTAGTTSYTYAIVAHGGTGTIAGSTATIATGNATLSSTNFNQIMFAASGGGSSWDIYRTACGGASALCTGGNATGVIGTISLPLQFPTNPNWTFADAIIFKDTGLNGDASSLPGSNTTGQIISTVPTGTAPLSIVSTTPVAHLTTVPTTYNIGGTQQTAVHIVRDHCTLGTSCSVTLTGSAVFTSSTSYECSGVDETSAAAVKFAPSSGSAFVLTGTGTDVISFICVGN